MFGIGPLVALMIGPRIVAKNARPRMRRSVLLTDGAILVMVGLLVWALGWRDYLIVIFLPALLAGSAGIWLFYVQHQFEDAYWDDGEDWTFTDAALRGSSFLKLPEVLRFCTGSIGYHHVHHLNAGIPNYNLKRAHDRTPALHDVPTLTLTDGMRATKLRLYDERRGRLVTFREAATPPVPVHATPRPIAPCGLRAATPLSFRPTTGSARASTPRLTRAAPFRARSRP